MSTTKERALAVLLQEFPKLAERAAQLDNPVLDLLMRQIELELMALAREKPLCEAKDHVLADPC